VKRWSDRDGVDVKSHWERHVILLYHGFAVSLRISPERKTWTRFASLCDMPLVPRRRRVDSRTKSVFALISAGVATRSLLRSDSVESKEFGALPSELLSARNRPTSGRAIRESSVSWDRANVRGEYCI